MVRGGLHAGEHLADQIKVLEMSAAEPGRQIKVPPNGITETVNAQRATTGDTTLRLGHFFGNTPQFWLNLQSIYDLRVAEKKTGAVIRTLSKLSGRGAKADRQLQPA